ncbi:MAG: hypothetical protein ABR578_00955 [Chromatocurvus sp.]
MQELRSKASPGRGIAIIVYGLYMAGVMTDDYTPRQPGWVGRYY